MIARCIGCLALALALSASRPALGQDYEAEYTLDFQNVQIYDVLRSLEKITRRTFVYDASVRGTMTVLSERQLPQSAVMPFTVFALETAGLSVTETASGEVKLERVSPPRDVCSRKRVDVARQAAFLAEGAPGRVSFEFVAAPALEVVREMAKLLRALIVVPDLPGGSITLESGGEVNAEEAFRMFAAALEREGNVLLAGPGGAFAVASCRGDPRWPGYDGDASLPRVLGVTLDRSGDGHRVLVWNGGMVRSYHVENSIPVDTPGLEGMLSYTFLEDRVTQLVEVLRQGVVLRRQDRCTLLAVGEVGAGREVPCPARRLFEPPPPEANPRWQMRDRR